METLRYFAEQAKTLELSPDTLDTASEEALRTFASRVLQELVAQGLLEDGSQVGCFTVYAGRSGDA